MKISDKIQIKVDQKIKQKLYAIDLKYKKIEIKNQELLEIKKQRDIDRAKRDSIKWWENQERKTQGKALKPKKINRVEKLDELRSKYIRWKYWLVCYTCWGRDHIWCWHYITRTKRSLRRNENNTRPQWFYCCNAKFSWNWKPIEFEAKLKSEWVDVEELKRIALSENNKPKEFELKALYEILLSQI